MLRAEVERGEEKRRAAESRAEEEARRSAAQRGVVAELTSSLDKMRERCRGLQDRNAALAKQLEQVSAWERSGSLASTAKSMGVRTRQEGTRASP